MKDKSFSYKSFVKNIYLELPNKYIFKHHSLEDTDDLFLGRQAIKKDFLNVLLNGQKRGAYLITGYRGMGKTSFVRQVIKDYKSEINKENKVKNRVKSIDISLAQTQIKEIDILKYIVNQLVEDIKSFPELYFIRTFSMSNIFTLCWPIITIVLILVNYYYVLNIALDDKKADGINTIVENIIGVVSLSGLLTLLLSAIVSKIFTRRFTYEDRNGNVKNDDLKSVFEDIITLQNRCNAQITSEDSLRETFSASALALFKKDTKVYPIASSREIEASLIFLLERLAKFREYIFVFDELDKIDTSSSVNGDIERDQISPVDSKTYLDDLRGRRHTITNVLSALKFFINEAKARFIFIAGREMFEASLADISDRQSSIGSIFHKVVYVDSFLKDNSQKGMYSLDIGGLVEQFLESTLLPKFFVENINEVRKVDLMSKYFIYQILAEDGLILQYSENDKIYKRIIYACNRLISKIGNSKSDSRIEYFFMKIAGYFVKEFNLQYLTGVASTYERKLATQDENIRQNIKFSFKKINENKDLLIRQRKVIFLLQNFLVYLVYRSNGSPRKMVKLFEEFIVNRSLRSLRKAEDRSILFCPHVNRNSNSIDDKSLQFLYFPYYTQYKLGFNSYLFQPLLTRYSTFIKRYSDNTLVSIPFLIDNLIKFHSTAFSIHNLELLPEILSTNKSPISRPFLEELVAFLGQNHIRRTEAGIFEYKFYDKTHNEIMFISKIFEEEAAAYNFTLDENYPVKRHLMDKIKLLRASHKDFENKTQNPVSSIIYLNRLLGDVRFQDEEYEDAIISYQDAIQMINKDNLSSLHLLISFIRIKLKLGLTYEKIKNYEFALGHYSGVIEEIVKQLYIAIKKDDVNGSSQYSSADSRQLTTGQNIIYRELMFFVLQAHMATLYLQEKLYEGILFQKINYIYSSMVELINQYDYSYTNRDLILASTCNNIGTILYYKNIAPPHSVNKVLLSYGKFLEQHRLSGKVINKTVLDEHENTLRRKLEEAFPSIDTSFILHSFGELSGKNDFNNTDYRVSSTSIIYYKYALKILLGVEKDNGKLNGSSIEDVQKEKLKDGIKFLLRECTSLIHQVSKKQEKQGQVSYRSSQHRRYLTSIGHTISKLGDAYLPLIKNKNISVEEALGCFFYSENDRLTEDSLKNLKDFERYSREKLIWDYYGLESKEFSIDNDKLSGDSLPPRFVLHIYYLSSLFFLDAGDTANSSFQLRKIIFSLRALQFNNLNSAYIVSTLECLENNLVRRILEFSSWMSHSSDRPQLTKFKRNFNIGTLRTPHKISHEFYSNVSNNSETKEAVLSYTLLKLEYSRFNPLDVKAYSSLNNYSDLIPESRLISPYNSISHQISRMMELELQTSLNYNILCDYFVKKFDQLLNERFKLIGDESWTSKLYNISKLFDIERADFDLEANYDDRKYFKEHVLSHFSVLYSKDKGALTLLITELSQLTINSIFNISQMLNIGSVFGVNYIVSHSYIAKRHQDMGFWLKFIHLCRLLNATYDLGLLIEDELKDLIGNQSAITLDTLTQYQISLQHYYDCLQMHKEGDAYSLQINNMMYLEDDYNDNLYHFGAALERLKINSGSIRKQIEKLEDEIKRANMHKYSAYVGK